MMPWIIMNYQGIYIISFILMNFFEEYWSERRDQSMFEMMKME